MEGKIKIFFCYAHEDEALRKGLEKQLSALQRQGLIEVWHDRNISAGTEWEKEISQHLNTAQIILLLISSDFMNSDFCYSIEMEQAIERHKLGEACVVPIILRPVYWQKAPFSILQALPTNAKPVVDSSWHDLDEAFFDVAEGIRKIVESITANSSTNLLAASLQTSNGGKGGDLNIVRNDSPIISSLPISPIKKYPERDSLPKIFLSHSKHNRRRAEQLASLLLLNNIPVWFDDWEILVGHNIYDQVYAGILSSDYLAVLITRASLQSRWVNEELSLARQREFETPCRKLCTDFPSH